MEYKKTFRLVFDIGYIGNTKENHDINLKQYVDSISESYVSDKGTYTCHITLSKLSQLIDLGYYFDYGKIKICGDGMDIIAIV